MGRRHHTLAMVDAVTLELLDTASTGWYPARRRFSGRFRSGTIPFSASLVRFG
jgi:hypothetical protein